MALSDNVLKIIKEKGWMALTDLYFDNAVQIEIFNSRGYIAINPNNGIVYSTGIIDITNTSKMEDQAIIMPEKKIYHQQTIYVTSLDHLQGYNIANYSHWSYCVDSDTVFPIPKIPTKAKILAYTLDADDSTGSIYGDDGMYTPHHKFTGADTSLLRFTDTEESVISLYPDKKYYRASAVIGWWQMFYKNQEKFIAAIEDEYGESGLI